MAQHGVARVPLPPVLAQGERGAAATVEQLRQRGAGLPFEVETQSLRLTAVLLRMIISTAVRPRRQQQAQHVRHAHALAAHLRRGALQSRAHSFQHLLQQALLQQQRRRVPRRVRGGRTVQLQQRQQAARQLQGEVRLRGRRRGGRELARRPSAAHVLREARQPLRAALHRLVGPAHELVAAAPGRRAGRCGSARRGMGKDQQVHRPE
eukprot:scaffold5115_cov269-Prasinococcus_capsulatus_cf.AAC.2